MIRFYALICIILCSNITLAGGDLRVEGRHAGSVESDGTVRIGGSNVGKIEKDGTVRKNGRNIGSAKGVDPKYAAVIFFFGLFDPY